MTLQAGMMIKSTVLQNNTVFDGVTVFITEYNTDGAIGFVTNKPFHRQLNELEAFKNSPDFPLYDGGPVDREHIFFIHQRPDLITGGTAISHDVFMGGDFKEAVNAINTNRITSKDIKIFIGYCGWNAGELDAEIKEGSWVMTGEMNIFNNPIHSV